MAGVRYGYSTATDRAWESDAAHQACMAWLEGWRQTHGADQPPPVGMARAVGETTRRLTAEGVSRVELARLMWAAGRDGDTLAEPADDTAQRAA